MLIFDSCVYLEIFRKVVDEENSIIGLEGLLNVFDVVLICYFCFLEFDKSGFLIVCFIVKRNGIDFVKFLVEVEYNDRFLLFCLIIGVLYWEICFILRICLDYLGVIVLFIVVLV